MTEEAKPVRFKMKPDYRLAGAMQRVFIFEFGALDVHRQSVNASFVREIADAKRRWDALPDDTDDDSAESYAEELALAIDLLPRLQWSAQFVLVFATFEDMLIKLCKMGHARLPSGKPLGKIWTTGMNGAKEFLKQIDGAGVIFGGQDWECAVDFQKLRNAIVHNGGRIDLEQTPDLSSVLKRFEKGAWPGVSIYRAYTGGRGGEEALPEAVLTSDFVEFVIEALEKLVREIADLKLPTPI